MGGALVDGKRHPLAEMVKVANDLSSELSNFGLVFVGGSVAREMETCGDIDLVFLPKDEKGLEDFNNWCDTNEMKLTRKIRRGLYQGMQVDMWIADENNVVTMVQFVNGSGWFNGATRSVAKRNGMKLSQLGLWRDEELLVGPMMKYDYQTILNQEQEIFDALGLNHIPLNERSAMDSREAFWIINKNRK